MTASAEIAAGLRDGASLAHMAKRFGMSTAVARDLLSPADRRAIILRALTGGATIVAAARQLTISSRDALWLLGVADPDAPTPDDVRDLVLSRFEVDKAQPTAIETSLGLTGLRIMRILVEHRPREYVRRQMTGGMSPEAVAEKTGLSLAFVMRGRAAAVKINAAKFHAAPRPRILLRTTDGRSSTAADPEDLAEARRIMTVMAKGRAWTEERLG